MDKRSAICNYLKKHHSGKETAVFSRELERLFSLDGRALRRIIHSLRQDGHPICGDVHGYYFAENSGNQEVIKPEPCSFQMRATYASQGRIRTIHVSVRSDGPGSVNVRVTLE